MGAKQVLASTGVGTALFAALSVAAMLTMVAFMAVAGAGSADNPEVGAMAAMFVGLGMMMLLLFLGPLEGLIVGAVVGLRHRGDWKAALPAGLLAGLLGYLLQALVLTTLLAAVVNLIGVPGEALQGQDAALGGLQMTAVLGAPVALVSMVAALATASAFRGSAADGDEGGEDESPGPAAPQYVPPPAATSAPPTLPAPLPNPAAILGLAAPAAGTQGAPPPAAAMAAGPGAAPPPPAAPPPGEGAPKKPNWAP